MENLSFIKGKIGLIVLAGLMTGALSFLFLVVNEKSYKASGDYLIVQNVSVNQDSYTLAKSAEYIGKVISEAAYSEIFIDEIVKTGKINTEFLPFDKRDRLKQWSQMISISRNPELGILSVEVFSDDQRKVRAISEGFIEVLTTKNHLFRGSGQDIEIRVLSGPVIEKNPSISQIIGVALGGFIFGILISLTWLYYKSCKRHQRVATIGMTGSVLVSKRPYPFSNVTKERMEESGIFAPNKGEPTAEEYRESLKYLDK